MISQEGELHLAVSESVVLPILESLTEKHLGQLVWFSQNDPDVLENTHDKDRFANVEKAREWFLDKKVYILTDGQGEKANLKGIIWFQRLPLPDGSFTSLDFNPSDYGITYAIRLYEDMRGKKLATNFTHLTMDNFMNTDYYKQSGARKIWLSVKTRTNLPGMRAYEKFGFRQISDPCEDGRILMIYDPVTEVHVGSSA